MTNEVKANSEVKTDSEAKASPEVKADSEVKVDSEVKAAPETKKPLKGKDINVQDVFLGKAKNEKIPISVFFEKVKMVGIVKNFDQFSITLDSNGQEQMIYKQGINYIGLPKPKRAFKPRPGGFRPREAREGDLSEDQSSDRPRKPFTPRPYNDSDQRSPEGGFKKPYERRTDSQGERRYDSQSSFKDNRTGFQNSRDSFQSNRDNFQSSRDSSQSRDNFQSNRDSSQRSPNQGPDDSKKVFRVTKPFPKKS